MRILTDIQLQKLFDYFSMRPWNEVNAFIVMLSQLPEGIEKPLEYTPKSLPNKELENQDKKNLKAA